MVKKKATRGARKGKKKKPAKKSAPAWVAKLASSQRKVLNLLRPILEDPGPCERIVEPIGPGEWRIVPKP